jgi:hypothetical protein
VLAMRFRIGCMGGRVELRIDVRSILHLRDDVVNRRTHVFQPGFFHRFHEQVLPCFGRKSREFADSIVFH